MIALDTIEAVLLPDGKWYEVTGQTLDTTPGQFTFDGKRRTAGRAEREWEKPYDLTGAWLRLQDAATGQWMYFPAASVMALRARKVEMSHA